MGPVSANVGTQPSSGPQKWHGEAEHSGGVRIDDQLELVQLNNWQFRRLGALKDAANIATGLAICIDNVASVAYQASNLHKITHPVDGGESIERRQMSQLDTTIQKC